MKMPIQAPAVRRNSMNTPGLQVGVTASICDGMLCHCTPSTMACCGDAQCHTDANGVCVCGRYGDGKTG